METWQKESLQEALRLIKQVAEEIGNDACETDNRGDVFQDGCTVGALGTAAQAIIKEIGE